MHSVHWNQIVYLQDKACRTGLEIERKIMKNALIISDKYRTADLSPHWLNIQVILFNYKKKPERTRASCAL